MGWMDRKEREGREESGGFEEMFSERINSPVHHRKSCFSLKGRILVLSLPLSRRDASDWPCLDARGRGEKAGGVTVSIVALHGLRE